MEIYRTSPSSPSKRHYSLPLLQVSARDLKMKCPYGLLNVEEKHNF